MKRVTVNFVSLDLTDCQGDNLKISRSIICDDDVDNYDIMAYYEEMINEGWVISAIIQSRGFFKICPSS